MEPDLVRLVLIVLGVLLVVGIYLWDRYKHAPPRRRPRRRRHMPGDLPRAEASPEVPQPDPDPELESDLGIDVDNPAPVQRRATAAKEKASGGRPVREEAPLDPEPEAFDSWSLTAETAGDPQFSMDLSFEAEGRSDYLGHHPGDTVDVERLIVVVNVIGSGAQIGGAALQRACAGAGLEAGEMSIYHRRDPAAGGVLFSVANMVEPGVFPFDEMEGFTTPGVSLFTQLPGVRDGVEIYQDMLDTARHLAANLGAELQDERHNKLTRQMQEHTRERIIEHRRRLRLARSRR
ncbi:MAG: hypothetical protein KDI88_07080 [Gammaproteobacteria bacterium]|nr:hypothetical protein [Gammaproteobacteria bacterium]